MNVVNRIIVLILALLVLLSGVLVLLIAAGTVVPGDLLLLQFESVAEVEGTDLATTNGIAGAMVVFGVLLLIFELRTIKTRPQWVLVSAGEEGVVRMALDSIRELVERTGESNRSVRKPKCRVCVTSGGLRIRCFANLSMGMEVPKVSAELQESINDIVQRMTGLAVVDVAVKAKYRNDEDLSLVAR